MPPPSTASLAKQIHSSPLLAVNVGSSSIKASVFNGEDIGLLQVEIGGLGSRAPYVRVRRGNNRAVAHETTLSPGTSVGQALTLVEHELGATVPAIVPRCVVHRIVHGGDQPEPVIEVSDVTLTQLRALTELAPLHQPFNLAGIEHFRQVFPEATHLACSDTAFHAARPARLNRYAIPDQLCEGGIRRYGFHGLALRSVMGTLSQQELEIEAEARVVVAHLGSGCSITAVQSGISIASTMGCTPLDGVAMATRCGHFDPGALLALLRRGFSAQQLEELLYKESGLKAISGFSGDMRDLVASQSSSADEAVEYFVQETVKGIGAMIASMDGADVLVFSGGIGEHQHRIRDRIIGRLAWYGFRPSVVDGTSVSAALQDRGVVELSDPSWYPRVFVVAIDEQRVMLELARGLR